MQRFSEQQILPECYIVSGPCSEMIKTNLKAWKQKSGILQGADYNLIKNHRMKSEAKPSCWQAS